MKTISCMNIDVDLLHSFGAENIDYKAGKLIFKEGHHPHYYFQIIEGKVKLNNYDDEGKEFIHNILYRDQSFGDSLLFLDKLYPSNATSITSSKIIRMSRDNFMQLLKIHPEISLRMNACLSQRLYYKVLMTRYMSTHNPVTRLKGLMEYLKSYTENDHLFHIELTRQQIANLTGLRVETVIRSLKKMEKENLVKIENNRILY